MSEDLQTRPTGNEAKLTRAATLDKLNVLRDMELCERCVCDCGYCNKLNGVHQHGRDCVTRTVAGGGGGLPTTSTARRRANLQHTSLRFRQSSHHPGTSKQTKTRKFQKPCLNINLKVKNITKQISTKCLQKIRVFKATKNTLAKRSLFKPHRNINQLSSIMENGPRRINKHFVRKTASRLRLSKTYSLNTLKSSAMISSVSSSNTTITAHPRERHAAQRNNSSKTIAANLLSKLILYLKSFMSNVKKLLNTKKINRETSNELPKVTLNYIFPYQSNSCITLEEINNQSSMLNAVSDLSSAPSSSLHSFNDQGIQVSQHSVVRDSVFNVDNFVKKLPTFNVQSQCILRPNDLLLQYKNKNAKTVTKKSPRVVFRGHHKRFMTRTYRQHFNKTYHTFLAEINYTNQPSKPFPMNRQGVGIGSTWDVCIDFGRSQDFPVQDGAASGFGPLQPFQCSPGICVTNKCDPNKCLKRIKNQSSHLKRSAPYGSHVSTQSRMYKLRDQKAVRENIYGGKNNMTKRRKNKKGRERSLGGNQTALTPAELPCRQAVRIGSKCSFNVKLYKETPLGARTVQPMQRKTSGQNGPCNTCRKAARARKKRKPLKTFECEPGICVSGKCNPSECLKQFECKPKVCIPGKCDPSDCYRRQRAVYTDTSIVCSSNCSSEVSTQARRLKGRDLRAGRETFYKEKGILSKQRPKAQLNIPNSQAVRIGSKCSFNIEFYRCWPQNAMSEPDRSDTSDGRKGSAKKGKKLKEYQCEPGVCLPRNCNANQCLQQIKNRQSTYTDASSQGSQASTKRKGLRADKCTFYSEKGVSCMPRSKMPLQMGNRQAVRIGSTCSFNIEFYKCSPYDGFMTSGQNYQSMRSFSQTGKPKGIFECEPGVCVPGKCNPSECFKQFECSPKVCVPGKCDPADCIQRLRGTPTDTSFTGSSIGTQSRKFKRGKLRSLDKTLYKEKGVSSIPLQEPLFGKPNRQVVRIGSNCSFNIEFYKAISPPIMSEQNYLPGNSIKRSQMGDQSDSSNRYKSGSRKKRKALNMYECPPGVCIPGQCNALKCYNRSLGTSDQSDTSGKTGRKRNSLTKYQCEPGICVPGKCTPRQCFQLFKDKQSIDNDGSLTDSSFATSRASQASKKLKSKLLEFNAGNAKFFTERGASSMPRPKTPLHLQNRAVVRIGSTCSFNMEFYKENPHKRGKESNAQQIQNRQYPLQYNIDEIPAQYYPSSSETSGDRASGQKCECTRQFAGLDKKEKPTDKRETHTGKKEKVVGKVGKGKQGKNKTKQLAGQHDQGDTTVQQTISSSTGMKSKELKRKKAHDKQSSSKNEQGDATKKPKISSKGQAMMIKEKRTKGKQSQTTVRDQQSETSVNEKVGTDKLQDQGDTPVESNVDTKKVGKKSKEKPKYEKGFEYEFGVCIPNKCDPNICFERLKNITEGTSTEASLSTKSKVSSRISDTGSMSKSTNVYLNRKEEAERKKIQSSTLPVYKQMGTSSIASSKYAEDIPQRIPPLGTSSRKKQAVRIGSSCSINIQFFKDKPLAPAQLATLRSASTPPKPRVPDYFVTTTNTTTPTTPTTTTPTTTTPTPTQERSKCFEGKLETLTFATFVEKFWCVVMEQLNPRPSKNGGGTQHGSQTASKLDIRPAICDFARCAKNQCPRSCNMETGMDTYGRAKSCCTNAATQSRRCPGLQQLSLNDNSLGAALCKCVAKLGPSRAPAGIRNGPYPSIVPGGWPFDAVAGYGDNFNRFQIREQAVILGSGCGFNFNFFKKRK